MSILSCYDCSFLLKNSGEFNSSLVREGFHLKSDLGKTSGEPVSELRFESRNELYDFYFEGSLVVSNQTRELVSRMAINRIHQAVAEKRPELSFLKGDAVIRDSEVVLLLGGEFSGQSRLRQYLQTTLGFGGLSENFVVLNGVGEVLKYPSPKMPMAGMKSEKIFLLTYVPAAELEVSPLTPPLACLHLFNLLRGDDSAIARSSVRLARLCESVRLRLTGKRGEVDTLGPFVKEYLAS